MPTLEIQIPIHCPECGGQLIDATVTGDEKKSWLCLAGHRITPETLEPGEPEPEFPLITCLMPTKNRRAFLPAAIAGFLTQAWPNKELIVLSDGDSVEDLIPADPQIRHVRFEGSLGAKLNEGARLARGTYLANVDDDDCYTADRLALQFSHMQITGKGLVACNSALFYCPGQPDGFEYYGPSWYAMGATHFYLREWALAHPHQDISLGEDTAFSDEAHAAGQLSTLSGLEIIVVSCHPGNTSQRDYSNPEQRAYMLRTDNWRVAPLNRITAITQTPQLTGV